ncbi:hypothetical protein [Tenacibaculum finnmarkense]|uniref:hypothetical protein n=1 Tax=Tenacibaculum finnmarkense TaxID=2781243 RepID=UPI001E42777C|nr:hypothetical protein [Tenacibaculum finnmarkense]MCD8402602.1 hypothetical protein [Tenacibaculum finnmarkense genomovar finnmarkense]WCC47890.1 hypothetical protein PJH08_04100 [Tenacibaculum finnmarkense]
MINYKLLFVFSLFFISLKINAQQFKVVDNKGTINTVFKNTVTTGTPPTTPIEGDVWFDTANSEIKIYDAAVWKKITNTNPLLDNIYTADGTITTDRTITGNTANRFNIGSFKGFFIYNTEYIALQATKGIDFQATNGINLRSTTIAHENFQAIKSFLDKDGDAGTNGQVLSSTGTVTNWVDNTAVSTWLALDDNLTADKNDTEIYKNDNVGIGDFSATTIDAKLHVKSTDVPFKIEPNTTTPTGTSGGQMFVDSTNGILYIYDGTRAKWLSVDRTMVGWGVNNANTTNQYLRQFNGAQSSQNGWRMIRNGTITAISAQTDINQTWTLEIRKNDGTTAIASLTITNQQGNHNNSVNIDVNEGDFIQAYCNGSSVDYPETLIEIAWRK